MRSNVTIRGVDKSISVLKLSNDKKAFKNGFVFYTEDINPKIYTHRNPNDNYDERNTKYDNIHFEYFTIDFNRHPEQCPPESIQYSSLYGIALIHCRNSTIDNCCFTDYMSEEINNGFPAVVVFQSRDCSVTKCISNRITFIQSIYSENVTINDNHSEKSVGTSIETICGKGCVIERNYVNGVYWSVSCVGVNTIESVVRDNIVFCSATNGSCLTLGHKGYDYFSSSNTIVEGNFFESNNVRAITIQNGADILIKNNKVSCVLSNDSDTPTYGCVISRGLENKNLTIENNEMIAYGDKSYGVVTFVGSGLIIIRNNIIKGKRGITLASEGIDAQILNNEVYSTDYSITASLPKTIIIENNYLYDGISVKGCDKLFVKGNTFQSIDHSSYIYGRWNNIAIQNNVFNLNSSGKIDYLFLFNAEKIDNKYDFVDFTIEGNHINSVNMKPQIVQFSQNKVIRDKFQSSSQYR